MKKKYIELSTENIEEYTDKCRDILSTNITRKKEYIKIGNIYKIKLSKVNKELAYILTKIEKIIDEINKISKRIAVLEKGRVSLAYNHNQLLSKNNTDNNKINDARFYYNEIILELNRLIRRRDELKDMLKLYKDKKSVLMTRKKHFSKCLNKCVKNVSVCDHNMDKCYKVLNRIDNVYFYKTDVVESKFFTPKVKELKKFDNGYVK